MRDDRDVPVLPVTAHKHVGAIYVAGVARRAAGRARIARDVR